MTVPTSYTVHSYKRETGERVIVVATVISATRCVVAVEIDNDLTREEILKGANPERRAKRFAEEYERTDREIYRNLIAINSGGGA